MSELAQPPLMKSGLWLLLRMLAIAAIAGAGIVIIGFATW
jgi:hypothetical protein